MSKPENVNNFMNLILIRESSYTNFTVETIGSKGSINGYGSNTKSYDNGSTNYVFNYVEVFLGIRVNGNYVVERNVETEHYAK